MKKTIKIIKYGLIATILLVLTSCASFDMAQSNEYLGYAYATGKDGREQDYAKAFKYYKLAAEKNNSAAQANKVKKPVLIRAIAKLTRSGLKIAE